MLVVLALVVKVLVVLQHPDLYDCRGNAMASVDNSKLDIQPHRDEIIEPMHRGGKSSPLRRNRRVSAPSPSGLFLLEELPMKNQPVSQKGTGGSSAPQRTATGSGSRPMGSRITIPSSNPAQAQRIRPK